jgi:hypothetical protein
MPRLVDRAVTKPVVIAAHDTNDKKGAPLSSGHSQGNLIHTMTPAAEIAEIIHFKSIKSATCANHERSTAQISGSGRADYKAERRAFMSHKVPWL